MRNFAITMACMLFCLTPAAVAADSDGDGVDDSVDNCSQVANPDQRDSNGDGFGNVCDMDLNNDLIVNVIDLGLFKDVFFTADADADANGDGIVNTIDLGALRSGFFAPPGPGAVPPMGFGQRHLRYDFDFDNNGTLDAQSVFVYTAEGRIEQQTFTVIGDGTPDLFNPVGNSFVQDYTYNADGTLATAQVDPVDPTSADLSFFYTYDASGLVERMDVTSATQGLPPFQQYYLFTFDGDLKDFEEIFDLATDNLLVIRDYTYDAMDQLESALFDNQFGASDPYFEFDWNADGTLAEKRTDIDGNGTFDEVVVYVRAGGRLDSRITTGSISQTPPDFTEFFIYGPSGRLDRVDYDANSNGSIDAVGTLVWEDGPCELFFLPDFFPIDGDHGDASSFIGDVFACGP